MRGTLWRTLLLVSALSLAGPLVEGALAGGVVIRRPAQQLMDLRPLTLEVQITKDHWQGDIHIPDRWGRELRTASRSSLHFRFERPGGAPTTVRYGVYLGSAPSDLSKAGRALVSGSIGAPPAQGGTGEFDIDFTTFLPPQPNGRDYYVVLTGPAASGEGTSLWSNSVKVSYAQQAVTQFASPVLNRVVGSMDSYGRPRTWEQVPLAVASQIFRVEGTGIYEIPAETRVQFLKGSQVVREVAPDANQTHQLPSGETSLAVVPHGGLSPDLYQVRVKSSWGLTSTLPLYVAGREDTDHQFVGYVSNEESRFVDYVGGFREEFMGTWANTQYYWGETRFLEAEHLRFADSADLAYIAGHGSASWITLSSGQGCWLPNAALGSYSDLSHRGDLEYIVFHSCSVLSLGDVDGVSWRDRWRHTAATRDETRPFSGLHVAMGFRTTHHNGSGAGWWAADEFAENLEDGYSVRYSWYEAAEDARYLAAWTDNKPAIFYLRPHKFEKASQHNSTDYKYGDPDYLLDAYYME